MKQNHLTSLYEITFAINNDFYTVKDYTNKIEINDILKKYDDFIRTIRIDEDERLEYLSYKIYGTTDYWDCILLINNITHLSQLPADYDRVMEKVDEIYNSWLDVFGKSKTENQKELKYEEIKEIEMVNNEKFRYLKYIDPSQMSNFQMDIRSLKQNIKKGV